MSSNPDDERKRLLEVSRQFASSLDEDEVTRLLADGLTSILAYDTMAIYVADHISRKLTPIIVEGARWGKQDKSKWSIPFNRGIVGMVISSSRGELVNDAHKDPRTVYPEGVPISQEHLMSIPLRLGDYCWGALTVNRMGRTRFTEYEFEAAELLAAYASLALNNIRLIREIKESQALKQVIFDTISDSVVTVNEDGLVIYCNEITEKLFGYSQRELIGQPLMKLIPSSLRDRHKSGFGNYIATGRKQMRSWSALELTGLRKDGKETPIEVSFGETKMADGQRVFSAIIRDISERKRSEEIIKSTKTRLENLIKTLQAGVLVEDESRHIVLTNQAFCTMFHVPAPPEALTGADCSNAAEQSKMLFADPERFVSRIAELLANREVVVNEELALADGQTYSRDYVPIFVGNEYRGHMWLYRDITTQKRSEEDLVKAKTLAEESMRAKQDFLAKMSHELRTPINGVLGLTNLISQSEQSDENTEYLHGIKSSGEHLLSIINDILDLAKIEAGKMKIQRVEFRPLELMNTVIRTQSPLAAQKGVQLLQDFDQAIPPVLVGDPVRVSQILLNLLSNAIKFTQVGEVQIITGLEKREGNRVMLKWQVKDTGIGIAKDKLHVIFESFTQADKNTAIKFGGTGLGLTIVKQLVELVHGTIEVESTAGKGSTFTVRLPFEIGSEVQQVQEKLTWEDLSDFPGKQVLLVEDNVINQTVAKKTLEKWKIEVDIAGNGVLALEKLKSGKKYDLVIMDIQMPEMDGFEATARIRNDLPKPICDVPILAMTASVMSDAIDRMKSAQMNDYIPKPFHYSDLNHKLSVLFGEPMKQAGDHVNMAYLESISPGNKGFQKEVLEIFSRESKQYLNDIKNCLKAEDIQGLALKAHGFKPTGSYIGVDTLSQKVGDLEKMARSGAERRTLVSMVDEIENMVNDINKEVNEKIKRL